jgi:hypothetical protein
LTTTPGWLGVGNHTTFEERQQVGAHDFGFNPENAHAGGGAGEIGGSFFGAAAIVAITQTA